MQRFLKAIFAFLAGIWYRLPQDLEQQSFEARRENNRLNVFALCLASFGNGWRQVSIQQCDQFIGLGALCLPQQGIDDVITAFAASRFRFNVWSARSSGSVVVRKYAINA